MKSRAQIAFLLLLCVLSSCGGGSSDDSTGSQSSINSLGADISFDVGVAEIPDVEEARLSAVAGLWDATYVDPEFGENVIYFEILSDGRLTRYDYRGDEFFRGFANCYAVQEVSVRSLGGDQYEIDNGPDLEPALVTWNRSDDDTLIEISNGQRFVFPELIGISSASLMSCT